MEGWKKNVAEDESKDEGREKQGGMQSMAYRSL